MPNQAGSLDTNFGTGGKVITDFNGGNDAALSVVLTSDNKIIVGGYASTDSNSNNSDFALAKYSADGDLDINFGTNGKVTTDFNSGDAEAFSVVLTSDNKIIVGGTFFSNTGNIDFALAKYNNDGSLDTNFGNNGKVITDFNGEAFSVVLTSDNKIIVGGTFFSNTGNSDFALAKYYNTESIFTIDEDIKYYIDSKVALIARYILSLEQKINK